MAGRNVMLAFETLQERAELFFTEPSITDDAAHRERVDGIVPGNGDDPNTVGHHDVLALSRDPKSRLLQSPDGVLMVDTRNARHVLRGDLHFADDRSLQKVIADG